ncbi:MAG: ParB/RepB/Spo0J family partition protein [Acidobacteria bacterium]|nr:ParB/RepB/Spo0J family partition protein [Acidobacteriota bacterium]
MVGDKRKALGRGLEALLPSRGNGGTAIEGRRAAPLVAVVAPGHEIVEIPVDQIDRNPHQTRTRLDEDALNELAASIAASGVVQPIVVRPAPGGRYELIAGQRRWLASMRAGKTAVPAIVRAVSPRQAMEMAIIENLQREDLNPMEQARAYEKLAGEFAMTQEEMAERTGKQRSSVANFLRLLKLPLELQGEIEQERLSFGHAKVLMTLGDPEAMLRVARRVVEKALSVRQTEELVHSLTQPAEKPVRQEKKTDPNVRAAEQELERLLGARVEIKDRKGKGKIVIEYSSLEEFDRIIASLNH